MKTRALAALALVVLLAGCGGTADDGADESPAAPEVVQEERPKGEQPAEDEPADDEAADDEPADPASDAGAAALDAYVASELAAMEGMPGLEMYSSVDVEAVYPSTARFTYVYADPIDPAAAAAYFDSMLTDFQDLCDTAVFPAMTRGGVVDPAVTYAYLNSDGSLIWEHTLTSS